MNGCHLADTTHVPAGNTGNVVDEAFSFPASFAQQRLWFLDQFDPGGAYYNIPLAHRLIGALDVTDLENAFHDIIRRHELLRAHFEEIDGEAVQVISDIDLPPLPFVDLTRSGPQEQARVLDTILHDDARRPFDLSRAPLIRATLIRLAEREHVLLVNMHHIVSDGWSMGIFWHELSQLYRARRNGVPPRLPELSIQYVDFTAWQRDQLQGKALDADLGYWSHQLAGATALELPTDRPRPTLLGHSGARYAVALSPSVSTDLKRIGREANATPFMAALTLFQILLSQSSGQHDILVGTPIAGRNRTEIEPLIGFFVNTLVLRADLSGNPTFNEALLRVRETCLEAYAHQNLPFDRLVEELRPVRDLSRHPLFQVMFTFQDAPQSVLSLEGLVVETVEIRCEIAKFDLTLSLTDGPDGMSGFFEYNTDLFDEATIAGMARRFVVLAENLVAAPTEGIDRIPRLSQVVRRQVLDAWNDTASDFPEDRCVHELFEEQAARTPDAVAVVQGTMELSYRSLNSRANRLARSLRELGVGPEVLVALCLDRSPSLLVAMLGTLKAGGAYVPLDPAYPRERLRFMLEDCKAPVLLTRESLLDRFEKLPAHVIRLDDDLDAIDADDEVNPAGTAAPENAAYVIYTSGSTGLPKGVVVTHRNIVNHNVWAASAYGLTASDRVLQFSSISFDTAVEEIYPTWVAGATLVLWPHRAMTTFEEFHQVISELAITVLNLPTAYWQAWTSHLDNTVDRLPERLRMVVVGGEKASGEILRCWRERAPGHVAWLNCYGPTETTVTATLYRPEGQEPAFRAASDPPIGRPIANTTVYILDEAGEPVSAGEAGELFIGGMGVARGYLHREDLTSQRFVMDRFGNDPTGRLYRTGDRVRFRSDGEIEYLGRLDDQVKLRGYRIEPGEVEAALMRLEPIQTAVVAAREGRLVAYVVFKEGRTIGVGELRGQLGEVLPDYMVPAVFVELEALPLTPNGKIDRKALPEANEKLLDLGGTYQKPRTPTEEMLTEIWVKLLGIQRLGIYDNLLHLGAQSLLVAQFFARVRQLRKKEITFSDFYEDPTVASLAKLFESVDRACPIPTAPSIKPRPPSRRRPVSFSQEAVIFLNELEPNNPAYRFQVAIHMVGELDLTVLEQAMTEIVRRHEILRTTFPLEDGSPHQHIHDPWAVSIPVVDLTSVPEDQREDHARAVFDQELKRPFNVTELPLIRWVLVRLDPTKSVLLQMEHHLVHDGWSFSVLLRELQELYTAYCMGMPSPLEELPVQFGDHAVWQREWLKGDALQSLVDYWRKRLAGAPARLDLPLDFPRPAAQRFRGAELLIQLPDELAGGLRELSHRQGCTLFITMLAAYYVLLHRYTGQADLVIGTGVANRFSREAEALIGMLVNTIALRVDLSGDPTFSEFLSRLRAVALEAYPHQGLPFEKLMEELGGERELSRNPLVQTVFSFHDSRLPDLQLPKLKGRVEYLHNGSSKFDICITVIPSEDPRIGSEAPSITMLWEYASDLFKQDTIERMTIHYRELLHHVIAHPHLRLSQLSLLTEAERRLLLEEWNDNAASFPEERCLHELFEGQVARTPDAIAVVYEHQALQYSELNARANKLAHHLRRLGVGPDVLVGICVERSLEMVVGLLGILKAGGAYVPIDPDYPRERLGFMLEDAGVAVLLTQRKLITTLSGQKAHLICLDSDWESIAAEDETNPVGKATSENLAYVIYTSGSTGKPKGVMIPHRAICNHMHWMQSSFPLTDTDKVLQRTPFSFDASIWEFYAPLLVGAQLIMARSGTNQEVGYLVDAITDRKVTILQLVPSLLRMLLEQNRIETCRSLRRVFCGGEALPFDLREQCFSKLDAELINLYGPTEACIDATCWTCNRADNDRIVPIGRPISNTQVYLLDSHLNPLPIGVPGELHIGGLGLARGYLNQPELTAARFIPNPFNPRPGSRLYKTGDVGRYRPDGSIEYLGRNDYQVKIRGFRIELGEIEAALRQNDAIREVVVLAREDRPGDKRLVAYVVPDHEQTLVANELRGYLKQKLPSHMVPSAFVFLAALPLAPNGKVDRRSLPGPDAASLECAEEYLAPCTSIQDVLAKIWCDVLGLARVGILDDFFLIGGHSILAMRVMSRIRAAFDIVLPLRTLFEFPTVAGLAAHIAHGVTNDNSPPLAPTARAPYMPISFAQRRLWFLDRFQPGLPLYNITMAVRLEGVLDPHALEQAFNEIVRRHEVLRTTFRLVDEEPMQVIGTPQALNLPVIDMREPGSGDMEGAIDELILEESRLPFDLSKGPMLRVKLLRPANEQHVLVITMHHIVSDGWSMGVLLREISSLYASASSGRRPTLPPLPVQYSDYAVWQRASLQGAALDPHLEYWKRELADLPNLELPTDRPRMPVRAYRGGLAQLKLPLALSDRILNLSRQEGVTLFMVLLAGFQILLHRHGGQNDIAVGSPIAGRKHADLEGLIGLFVNTLVLRTDLSGDPSAREMLARVRNTALRGYAHEDLPFEKLVEAVHPQRDLSHSPMFQVMFTLQDGVVEHLELPGLDVTPLMVESKDESSKFDLTLFALTEGQGLRLSLEYDRDLFDAETAQRMLRHLQLLLEGMTADPTRRISTLPLLRPQEQRALIEDWNATTTEYPRDRCVHELFAEQARRTPDAVALVFREQRIRYHELNARANQLAHYLGQFGVGPDVPVGVYLDRSPETVVAVLAAMKAGGAYVPLDPAYPRERIRFMLEDSNVPVVLTLESMLDTLPSYEGRFVCLDRDRPAIEHMGTDDPVNQTLPEQLSNIIYTSGSTGVPKGVEVPHRGVTRLVLGNDYARFSADEVFLQMAPLSFDASTFELWGALLHGATCVIFPERAPSAQELGEVIQKQGVTTLWLTASLFNAIIDEAPQVLAGIRQLLTGGEALSPAHVKRALELLPDTRIINGYGPTESTTFTCCYRIPRPLNPDLTSVPIGSPIRNTRVYVLDAHRQPVPIGIAGELYIGGDGLARGYRNRPELTGERFVPDPFDSDPSARLYRTGDLVRFLRDGNLEFLGRIDQQVKIRGFRIEPGEIETQLANHPDVRHAAVIAREDQPGELRLLAYIVPADSATHAADLRGYLADRLPEYMIPGVFVFLDALPLNVNGKLDRCALPAPEQAAPTIDSYAAPRSSVEEWMAHTWKELLGLERVGIHDNFFHLGGHSLLAVKLMERIRQQYQQNLPLAILFQAGTIASISKLIHENYQLEPWSPVVPIQTEGSKPPLFCVHPAGGNVLGFAGFSSYLGRDYPVYGLQARGVIEGQEPHTCVRTMASFYIEAMRKVQPEGPYYLGGLSFGGIVAYEMAVQLQASGQKVAMVFIGDTWVTRGVHFRKWWYRISRFTYPFTFSLREIITVLARKFTGRREAFVRRQREPFANELHQRMGEAHALAMNDYFAGLYSDKVILFRNKYIDRHIRRMEHYFGEPEMCWRHLAQGGVDLHWLPGTHHDMFYGENAAVFAARVKECIERTFAVQKL